MIELNEDLELTGRRIALSLICKFVFYGAKVWRIAASSSITCSYDAHFLVLMCRAYEVRRARHALLMRHLRCAVCDASDISSGANFMLL